MKSEVELILISDRKIDKEAGSGIRKLFQSSTFLSLRPPRYYEIDNKSQWQHAASCGNTEIRWELRKVIAEMKARLAENEIRHGNGETQFDTAWSDEVRELLTSARFDVVQKKFLRKIEFTLYNLFFEILKFLEADPAFKVLKTTESILI